MVSSFVLEDYKFTDHIFILFIITFSFLLNFQKCNGFCVFLLKPKLGTGTKSSSVMGGRIVLRCGTVTALQTAYCTFLQPVNKLKPDAGTTPGTRYSIIHSV
jgi:hypothetical protein